jgi:prevent-host-death family protein
MRIAPLADVKARLSAYLDECGSEGPVVITRDGKAAAVLLVPRDDDDLERLLLGRSPRFQALLNRSPAKHQGGEGTIREGVLGSRSQASKSPKGGRRERLPTKKLKPFSSFHTGVSSCARPRS